MSWTTEDGEHEGWSAAEFPDGRVSVSYGAGATYAEPPADAISSTAAGVPQPVDGRTAIGWRGLCMCGWKGPLWRRVPAADTADPARRLVYWAEPDEYADPPESTEDAIYEEWSAHLPSPAVAEVKAAAAAARKAGDALDDAVRRARLDGATWAAIGDAAGMTRQSANERWGRRWQPVVLADGPRNVLPADGTCSR